MKATLQELIEKHKELTDYYLCNVSEEDYAAFEGQKQLLLKISEVENSAMSVYDMHRKEYLLYRSKFSKEAGYHLNPEYRTTPEFFLKMLHPDDLPFIFDTQIKTFEFLNSLPASERKDYKMVVDFCLRCNNGLYLRFVQQSVIIELDKDGKLWLALMLTDLVSGNVPHEPPQRQLIHVKTGKPCLFNDNNGPEPNKSLTKREIEILGLISQGYDSRDISERLFISVNTVNNHRQNILSKTKTENTTQALLYAKRIGII